MALEWQCRREHPRIQTTPRNCQGEQLSVPGLEKEWIAAYPDSTALRISLAYLYLNYSWLARGSGFANSVFESQWSLFKSRNAQAKAILFEAGALKEKDPFWYEATQLVAHDEGWDQAYVHELFDQSVGF